MRRDMLVELERSYPWIAWRRPVIVNERFYGCRVCIAMKGLPGNCIRLLPTSAAAWEAHFRAHHGVPAVDGVTAS